MNNKLEIVLCDQCDGPLTYVNKHSEFDDFVYILIFCKTCNEYSCDKAKRVSPELHSALDDQYYKLLNPILA